MVEHWTWQAIVRKVNVFGLRCQPRFLWSQQITIQISALGMLMSSLDPMTGLVRGHGVLQVKLPSTAQVVALLAQVGGRRMAELHLQVMSRVLMGCTSLRLLKPSGFEEAQLKWGGPFIVIMEVVTTTVCAE